MDSSIRKKRFILSGAEYYAQHLYITSAVLPIKLTEKEIEVLSLFMYKKSFNKQTREYIKDTLALSSASLSIYIKNLLRKGYIKRGIDDSYEVHDIVKVENGRIEYIFVLEKQSE